VRIFHLTFDRRITQDDPAVFWRLMHKSMDELQELLAS
jgi:hypothetical protein